MARLTFLELRQHGGRVGQNDAVDSWVKVKMLAWLRKHYAAWPWPFLISPVTGIALAAGTQSLSIGAGDSGISSQISRIFSPIYFRADGYATRGKAPVRQMVGGPAEMAFGNIDATNDKGAPQSFIASPFIENDGLLKISLVPYPIPDKTYTLALTCQALPDDCDDANVPVYPNEMTLIQACKVAAMEYDQTNDPVYMQEMNILASMVTADRDAYGGGPSFGDVMQLDDAVFPTDGSANPSSRFTW